MGNVDYQLIWSKEEILKELKEKFAKNKKIMEVLNSLGTDAISIEEKSGVYYFVSLFCDFTCKTSHSDGESYYTINQNYEVDGRFVMCKSEPEDNTGKLLLKDLPQSFRGRCIINDDASEPLKEVKDYIKESVRRQYDRGVQDFRVNEWSFDNYGDDFEYTYWKVNIRCNLKNDKTMLAALIYPDDISSEARQKLKVELQGYNPSGTGGCYVATCVYGSYDCPQVWTLRRYRDFKLSKTWRGRVFIKIYYTLSPTLVRLFGNTNWFKKCGEAS